jgi:hypothetical protein
VPEGEPLNCNNPVTLNLREGYVTDSGNNSLIDARTVPEEDADSVI